MPPTNRTSPKPLLTGVADFVGRVLLPLLFLTGQCHGEATSTNAADSSLASLDHLLDGLDTPPLNEGFTYLPDFHDCPLPCSDYANVFSWVRYWTPDQLQRCSEPLLLQFSVEQPVASSASSSIGAGVPVYACSLSPTAAGSSTASPPPIDNPKTSNNLNKVQLSRAVACAAPSSPSSSPRGNTTAVQKLVVSSGASRNASGDGSDVYAMMKGLQSFFEAQGNCDETLVFARHKQTTMGMYVGASLGKAATTDAVLTSLSSRLQTAGAASQPLVAQLCGNSGSNNRTTEQTLGIAMDATGDLSIVQQAVAAWSKGNCVSSLGSSLQQDASPVEAHVVDLSPTPPRINSTLAVSRRFLGSRYLRGRSADNATVSAATPTPPAKNSDGTCASYVIQKTDTCSKLATQYGINVTDIEKWNANKTWAWTDCAGMMYGNNMCLSEGRAPLPPPQQGVECGPTLPGTTLPTNKSVSMADLNPCPLNACCSNWGFCGVFPQHCDIHNAPGSSSPGAKDKQFQNTCISNCNRDIKQNSGPPDTQMRVGYYEAFGMDRPCLNLKAKNANVGGVYTHIHWAFAAIDPTTLKPVINDTDKQWADFKALQDVKRIVSFGGWSFSTDAATFEVMRKAILENRDTFAANVLKFVNDEGLDGADFDWEYPAAPDIFAGDQPIGQKGDGLGYLKFLITMKQKLGKDKSLSIAAPASFWYLKPFPIDRISSAIDYIVYMTYDLHGQWDYGNANSFDSCTSGKCIRSHVNLTETKNSLSIITKAGVANNKVVVGEASYGRSFHMAEHLCWGPLCEFTGSRNQSDATPGRCTQTAGYIANAEINELIRQGAQSIYDGSSDTDVVLYNGDYVAYMTPTTQDRRRDTWKGLNFAGTVNWAVDLQAFTADDMDNASGDRGKAGSEGCIAGDDLTVDTGDLCEFTCDLGFCPESLCYCTERGILDPLPAVKNGSANDVVIAWNEQGIDINKMCKFACTYGYCPDDVCTTPLETMVEDDTDDTPPYANPDDDPRVANANKCLIYENGDHDDSVAPCKIYCKPQLDAAAAAGRTSNYGCVGFWPLNEPIPWQTISGLPCRVAGGTCSCDNYLVNEIATTVLEALPIIAEIGCYLIMSTLKLVVDIGSNIFTGGALSAGLNAVTTAAQIVNYVYPSDQDPQGAFDWWLSPCGNTDLVPDDIKKAFGILSDVADTVTGFKGPKNIPKGSGRHGDDGNPKDQSKPRPTSNEPKPTSKPTDKPTGKPTDKPTGKPTDKPTACPVPTKKVRRGMGIGAGHGGVPQTTTRPDGAVETLWPRGEAGVMTADQHGEYESYDSEYYVDEVDSINASCKNNKAKKCKIPKGKDVQRLGTGKNTLRKLSCVNNVVKTQEMIVTSLVYAPAATSSVVARKCEAAWTQACYHYSSVIRENPQYATLTCPQEAASTKHRQDAEATKVWSDQHKGKGWLDPQHRQWPKCDRDEYPPAYLLNDADPAFVNSGHNRNGQLVRFVPGKQNQRAGGMWKGVCFNGPVKELSDREFQDRVARSPHTNVIHDTNLVQTEAAITVDQRPEFTINSWGPPSSPDDGLGSNPCWPSAIAPLDPGFALLTYDKYYDTHPMPYNYLAAYVPPAAPQPT
ncbi:hypothetical protein HMPREF1624_02898 [Sporothrix schenckii ATCC 58251]|uniref:chitinase n=1 Tax=Sporothrix schenckii (strain ATCC 58251 / de Perez 2211183) TaxID=1391915 RepID=U7Q4K6_SPOS1|nr:hypothetical protein HMPREF1624_02898 [Sporothrix schenckii ATCC 58251]